MQRSALEEGTQIPLSGLALTSIAGTEIVRDRQKQQRFFFFLLPSFSRILFFFCCCCGYTRRHLNSIFSSFSSSMPDSRCIESCSERHLQTAMVRYASSFCFVGHENSPNTLVFDLGRVGTSTWLSTHIGNENNSASEEDRERPAHSTCAEFATQRRRCFRLRPWLSCCFHCQATIRPLISLLSLQLPRI